MGSATINHALYLVVSHLRPAPRHRAARSLFQTVSMLIAPFLDQSPPFFFASSDVYRLYTIYIRSKIIGGAEEGDIGGGEKEHIPPT